RCILRGITPAAVFVNGQAAPRSLVLSGDPRDASWGPREAGAGTDVALRIPNPLRAGDRIEAPGSLGAGPLSIGIYDVTGRRVRVLGGDAARGALHIDWDGRTSAGAEMRTGIYFFRARQGEATWSRRVLIVR
ncbi:MAG: hypothetical protein GF330_06190, partial [Candidatus Eisenbacteria bacterium]|nr:hypothetical protein [Candidatus Eisenbacteria bacterium]